MAEGDLEYILTGLPGTEGAAISDFCYQGYKQKICEKIRKNTLCRQKISVYNSAGKMYNHT